MRTVYIITNVSASDWTMFLTGSDRWSNEAPDAAQWRTRAAAERHLRDLNKRRPGIATYMTAGVSSDEVEVSA